MSQYTGYVCRVWVFLQIFLFNWQLCIWRIFVVFYGTNVTHWQTWTVNCLTFHNLLAVYLSGFIFHLSPTVAHKLAKLTNYYLASFVFFSWLSSLATLLCPYMTRILKPCLNVTSFRKFSLIYQREAHSFPMVSYLYLLFSAYWLPHLLCLLSGSYFLKCHPTASVTQETFDPGQDLWLIHFVCVPDIALRLSESGSLSSTIEFQQSFKQKL